MADFGLDTQLGFVKKRFNDIQNELKVALGQIEDPVTGEFLQVDFNEDDPLINVEGALDEYGIIPILEPKSGSYDGIILAVAHQKFKDMGSAAIRVLCKPISVLYDLKYVLDERESDLRL